ncbi:arpA protein [Saccharopolyspora sp. NFXS83]|uniref:HalD/BesD family halogenase n=1 Tax=Saccharopolyspora sp. NFXS83 TaxID=2993560 RepID=UPI00224B6D8C|nr:arpA protein [Saccharopolyspora sp. NFXS83]MCX2731904.1 arpA protein [Saccharopolyspora sp. NFXS83]
MSASESPLVERVVDTTRYPLAEPDGPGWTEVVARARHDLAEHGCSVLPDFIRPALQEELRRECAEIAPEAHYDVEVVNAYNIDTSIELPPEHPGRKTLERGNAFVARDQIPAEAIIHRLYANPLFQRFLADCVQLPRIHPLADPLAGLTLNVVNPGMAHPWHFDTNEFAVSMLTQEPESGGGFEYCQDIRSGDEENFDDVRAVLDGDGEHLVRRLTLRPGDLQLFKGRYSLHRVTEVGGSTARYSAIFAYSERPGVIGSVSRTKQIFGRVLPEHVAAEGNAVRGDALLD